MISISQPESWWARSGKSLLLSDVSRNFNTSFSKTIALNSCIKFWLDACKLPHDFHSEESVVLFHRLAWILSSRSPSTFFSRKLVPISNHYCSFSLAFLCHLDLKRRSATALVFIRSSSEIFTSQWVGQHGSETLGAGSHPSLLNFLLFFLTFRINVSTSVRKYSFTSDVFLCRPNFSEGRYSNQ